MYNNNNYQTLEHEMPYLLPQYDVAPTTSAYGNTGLANNSNRKLSRSEKKAIKRQQKEQKKLDKQAGKQAKKMKGTNIGGPFIAPVAPREEFFMGQQPINEIQKPGLATGYGIPEMGAHQLGHQGLNSGYGSTYSSSIPTSSYTTASSYASGYPSQYSQGSPRVVYESAIPTTSYATQGLSHHIGGS